MVLEILSYVKWFMHSRPVHFLTISQPQLRELLKHGPDTKYLSRLTRVLIARMLRAARSNRNMSTIVLGAYERHKAVLMQCKLLLTVHTCHIWVW